MNKIFLDIFFRLGDDEVLVSNGTIYFICTIENNYANGVKIVVIDN